MPKNKQKTITKTNNTKKTSKILFLFKWPFPGRQDLFCSFSNSHTQRLSCFLVAGLDEWAIVVSESRFLTFENKVSVKPACLIQPKMRQVHLYFLHVLPSQIDWNWSSMSLRLGPADLTWYIHLWKRSRTIHKTSLGDNKYVHGT